jgi:hypothetical protein
VQEIIASLQTPADDPQLRGKVMDAIRELDGKVVTFVEFVSRDGLGTETERKNPKIDIRVTDNVCSPS